MDGALELRLLNIGIGYRGNYRVFADLLDISETIIVGENEIEDSLKMITGDTILNVDTVLHHPGYYYLLAADCVRKEHLRSGRRKVLVISSPH